MINKKIILSGQNYVRINKTTARKLYETGAVIYAVPCKLNPAGPWAELVALPVGNFESECNSFVYYNCTSETGKYISFYIKG